MNADANYVEISRKDIIEVQTGVTDLDTFDGYNGEKIISAEVAFPRPDSDLDEWHEIDVTVYVGPMAGIHKIWVRHWEYNLESEWHHVDMLEQNGPTRNGETIPVPADDSLIPVCGLLKETGSCVGCGRAFDDDCDGRDLEWGIDASS